MKDAKRLPPDTKGKIVIFIMENVEKGMMKLLYFFCLIFL